MQNRAFLFSGVLLGTLLASIPVFTQGMQGGQAAAFPHAAASHRTGTAKPILKKSYLPLVDQVGIRPEHQRIADEMLRLIDAGCRTKLQKFYVSYSGKLQSRGYAGETTIIMDGTMSEKEFRAVLAHEIVHFMDIGCLQGTAASGKSAFKDGSKPIYNDDPSLRYYHISWSSEEQKKKGVTDREFFSGYASSDSFEDMAEAGTMYLLQREHLRTRAAANPVLAAKVAWIETYLFPSDTTGLASGTYQWNGKKLPWDATKLPYVWHTEKQVARK